MVSLEIVLDSHVMHVIFSQDFADEDAIYISYSLGM